jgi:hypothetical protein
MFLLSQRRWADARCRGGVRCFWLIDLIVLNERFALLVLWEAFNSKLRWWFVVLSENRWIRSVESPGNVVSIFSCRRFSLRVFSTTVRPSLSNLLQSYSRSLESVSSLNCALCLFRIAAGFSVSLVRNLTIICAAQQPKVTLGHSSWSPLSKSRQTRSDTL